MSNIGDLIASALGRSKERDPRVIARRLVTRIPEEQLREVLADCLSDRVRIEMTRHRMQAFGSSEPKAGTSRWRRHRLGLLDVGMCVNGEWKALGDCTPDDLDSLADEHGERAQQELALERRYRDLAARMRAAGATTLRALAADDLELAA